MDHPCVPEVFTGAIPTLAKIQLKQEFRPLHRFASAVTHLTLELCNLEGSGGLMEGFFWNFGTLVIRLPVLPRQFSHLDFFRACGDQFRTQYLGCMCVCVSPLKSEGTFWLLLL